VTSAVPHVIVRRPSRLEHASVRSVVQTVVDDTYGGLWAEPPLRIDDEDWSLAWIAVAGAEIAGMTLTDRDWVSDLWVLRSFRGLGAGTALLSTGEAEIAGRGHAVARLRVVQSNTKARIFYENRDWRTLREFPHEHLPVRMIEMAKHLHSAY
jgi:ribosomal protein S18 acetylase RimI-like enzyme